LNQSSTIPYKGKPPGGRRGIGGTEDEQKQAGDARQTQQTPEVEDNTTAKAERDGVHRGNNSPGVQWNLEGWRREATKVGLVHAAGLDSKKDWTMRGEPRDPCSGADGIAGHPDRAAQIPKKIHNNHCTTPVARRSTELASKLPAS
jgi:hypothetical protein